MLPLAGTTLALLASNWYPSEVFVGDTFTYFAGMALAVAGILGHFSETLLLLLIPQVPIPLHTLLQQQNKVCCAYHQLALPALMQVVKWFLPCKQLLCK